jgi:hypothetical protein
MNRRIIGSAAFRIRSTTDAEGQKKQSRRSLYARFIEQGQQEQLEQHQGIEPFLRQLRL